MNAEAVPASAATRRDRLSILRSKRTGRLVRLPSASILHAKHPVRGELGGSQGAVAANGIQDQPPGYQTVITPPHRVQNLRMAVEGTVNRADSGQSNKVLGANAGREGRTLRRGAVLGSKSTFANKVDHSIRQFRSEMRGEFYS